MAEPKQQFKIFKYRDGRQYSFTWLREDDPSPELWDFVAYFDGTLREVREECKRREELLAANPPEGPDPVDRPAHYTGPVPGIECIEVTRHFDFLRGNAIKYIWRAAHKGNYTQDLQKAVWYLNKAIEQGCPQD